VPGSLRTFFGFAFYIDNFCVCVCAGLRALYITLLSGRQEKRQAKTEKSASSIQGRALRPYRSSRLSTSSSSSNISPPKAPLKYAAAIRPMHAGVPAALPNSAWDPPSPVPKSGKQETCSTQLRVPTRRRFRLKPLHCPLPLMPTRRALKTPRLHQNESSSGAR
jgi:hypothetical protein